MSTPETDRDKLLAAMPVGTVFTHASHAEVDPSTRAAAEPRRLQRFEVVDTEGRCRPIAPDDPRPATHALKAVKLCPFDETELAWLSGLRHWYCGYCDRSWTARGDLTPTVPEKKLR